MREPDRPARRVGLRRTMAIAAAFAGLATIALPPRAGAGLSGSPHDFSPANPLYPASPIARQGACSVCHVPHGAEYGYLWPRNLAASYDNALGMNGGAGGPTDRPNYRRRVTVACYDCHDFHAPSGGTPVIDGYPPYDAFAPGHKPQNVAFGFTKPAAGRDSGSTMREDAPGGASAGYYENSPPYPGSPSTYYGADAGSGSPFVRPLDNATLARSGGHYFKSADPAAGAGIYRGDKLPCSDCHDPHAWDSQGNWQAFFRKEWPAGSSVPSRLGSVVLASTLMANDSSPAGRRSDANSRNLCVACHGTSNGAPGPVYFNEIDASYRADRRIVQPPSTVAEHGSGSQSPCVLCHNHNSVGAVCNACHFYPGLAGGIQVTATHRKHVNTYGDNAAGRGYRCAVCHRDNVHNESGVTGAGDWSSKYDRGYVQVGFDNAWNPQNANGPAYDNAARTCRGLYCHGNGAGQASWGGTTILSPPAWDNAATAPCGTCHPSGAAVGTGNHPVHLDRAGHPRGPDTIDNAACSGGQGCHTAYSLGPSSSHVNTVCDFRKTSADAAPVAFARTGICARCHSDAATGAGTGDNLARANWADNGYRLDCLTCHNNAAGGQGNTKVDGTGRPAPNIEAYWAFSGHGAAAIDNAATTDNTTPGVNQVPPVPCRYCHDAASAHFGPGKDAVNPWRLLPATQFDSPAGALDAFCRNRCHIPTAPARHAWIVSLGEAMAPQDTHPAGTPAVPDPARYAVPPPQVPLSGALANKASVPTGTQNILCVSCHDPHGVGPAPAAPRTFGGVNAGTIVGLDNGDVRMLRYDYDIGSEAPLCRKCHT